jgi:hypothetical protein
MNPTKNDNTVIMLFNLAGVAVTLVMLAISLYLSTEVPLSTKGFWAIGVLMLCTSLVNFVKYRFDERLGEDRITRLEEARNEKILEEFVSDKAA